MARRAEEESAVRHGRRRVDLLAQLVLVDHLEFRPRLEHLADAVVVGEQDVPIDQHRRGVMMSAQFLHPQPFARPCFQTAEITHVGHHEEMSLVGDR